MGWGVLPPDGPFCPHPVVHGLASLHVNTEGLPRSWILASGAHNKVSIIRGQGRAEKEGVLEGTESSWRKMCSQQCKLDSYNSRCQAPFISSTWKQAGSSYLNLLPQKGTVITAWS